MHRLLTLLRNLFGRQRVEDDLSAEVSAYLDQLIDEKVAAGLSPEAARRAAKLELGGADRVKEEVRDVRSGALIQQLARDVRFGIRSLVRNPGFAGFAVLTFALAITGITVVASLVEAVLIRPLPYPQSDRLVVVAEVDAANPVGGSSVAAPNYLDWEKQNRVFSRMALYEYLGFNLSGDGEPEQVGGLRISHGVFDVLGAAPLLGRGFVPADDDNQNGRVVVLSHALWQRRFGADSSIVGRSIRINKEPYVVIGVMRRGFAFPSPRTALWVPINLNEEDRGRGSHSFWSIARLKDGVSFQQAKTEMRAIGDQLARAYPESNGGETVNVMPMRELWLHDVARILRILILAVGLVAIIAMANVASLLVARGIARRRELAARMALGGSRARIARQLVTEGVLLALVGGTVALALAGIGLPSMMAALPGFIQNIPFRDLTTISLNAPVFMVAMAIALAIGGLAGLIPAMNVIPRAPGDVLRDGESRGSTARRGRQLRNALVSIEVALAMIVLAGAALLAVSMRRELGVDPGFNPKGVVAMALALPQADFYGPPVRADFCAQLDRRMAAIPGTLSASAISHLPLTGSDAGRSFTIEGQPDPGRDNTPRGSYGVVCPGLFETLGIPLLDGRDFSSDDRADAPPVVVINQALRDRYFPKGVNPVGHRIRFGMFESTGMPWVTVIGVIANIRHLGLTTDYRPHLYRSYSQVAWPSMAIVARAEGSPAGLVGPIRASLREVVPEEPIGASLTLEEVFDQSVGPLRFPLVMFMIFASTAIALAAVGIFGVASQSVVQRTRELGIRRAIGATSMELYGQVLRQALTPVVIGIGVGIIGGVGAGRLLQGLLFGVTPTSVPTFVVVAGSLATIAVFACLVPAARAARIDPVVALREE